MKVSAPLLAQLLLTSSTGARLFEKTRTRKVNVDSKNEEDIDRIINGVEAKEDRYSYMVSLADNKGHFCGASLLANDIVLSAAHCGAGGGGYDAIIGRHKHNDRDGDEVPVAKEFIHPRYNDRTTNNDFMVLKLSRKTTAGTSVKINSSRSSPQDEQEVVVMGFGVTNESTQQTSNKLMEVTVDVVSDSDCRKAYGNEVTASTMICAASRSKDSCQGDSGGPLIIKGSNSASDIQVGIVSWGYGCADPSYPGVYAEVSAGYDFIQQIVCQESQDASARETFECSGSAPDATIAPSGGSSSGASVSQGNDDDDDDDFNYDDFGFSSGASGSSGNQDSVSGGSWGWDDYTDDDWDYDDDWGSVTSASFGGGGGGWDDYGYDYSYDDRYDDGNYDYDNDWEALTQGQSYGGGGGWSGSMADWWTNLWH